MTSKLLPLMIIKILKIRWKKNLISQILKNNLLRIKILAKKLIEIRKGGKIKHNLRLSKTKRRRKYK